MHAIELLPTDLTAVETSLWHELGTSQSIRLDLNEMPFDLPQELKQHIANKLISLNWNRYPDFYNWELTSLIAASAGVTTDSVILGNGSSALIQQLVSCFSKVYGQAVLEKPTFGFYHQVCAQERLPYQEWVLAEDGTYEIENFPRLAEPTLVMLTSPNNPMGTLLPLKDLRLLLAAYPDSVFVLDEAYSEFSNQSALSLVHEFANLMVLKTFSKGYGLPGLRLGYLVGSPSLVRLLKANTVPFTINIFTELVVKELLANPAFAQAVRINRERVKGLRDFSLYLLQELAGEDRFIVQPSGTNFLMLRFRNSELHQSLKDLFAQRGIRVSYPMPLTMRITIGTEPQMHQLVRLIKHVVNVSKPAALAV
ncbi:histidinol-phosphate transaminase [Nibrella saemangeumensis]|uniref:histidinol-phosphate transaminase n=1 Tax=Nibrella saemangeumensis TaxID=1084526 RepID=A0ABP8NBS9_9BACT